MNYLLFPKLNDRPYFILQSEVYNKMLNSVPGVSESEGMAEELEHPERSDDGCPGDVPGGHRNLVIFLLQVQPRENS